MSASPDIFLSYNREDAAVAKLFADGFEAAGMEVWWDVTLRSGEAYDKVTEASLRGAKAVVVLWSPRSVESRWVRIEATIADRNGTLMPVTIEPCERPIMFELTQTADLSHWRGDGEDEAWLVFLGDVRRKVGRSELGICDPIPTPAPIADGRGAPSIVAVLPFTHRASDEEMELLAEDITEEITRELVRNFYFEVIAAGTMAAWRGKAVDHRALGQELGARYLVEGKLQRVGEDVRLTVQMIDTATVRMLWSQRFTRKLSDVAASPDELQMAVTAELDERIVQTEVTRAAAKPGPCSGWDHLLRSLAYIGRSGMENESACIEEVRLAVAAAPDLGKAHALLAVALGVPVHSGVRALNDSLSQEIRAHASRAMQLSYGSGGMEEVPSREMRTHVTRAMQLDGNNPGVFRMLAVVYSSLGDGESALRLARRAVEQQPNSPVANCMLGMVCVQVGRTADAIAAFMQQDRLAPHDLVRFNGLAFLGMCLFLEGQPEAAEEALDQSLALNPDHHLTLKWKAIVAAHRGKEQVALATIGRLREVEPEMTIDQHVRQMTFSPKLAAHTGEHVTTLRRLWAETGSDG